MMRNELSTDQSGSSSEAKLRFPLYARILTWFFLNLLLIGVAMFWFAEGPARLGLDSLLAGRSGERIDATARLILNDLRDGPPIGWEEVLARFDEAHEYRVHFLLAAPDRSIVAGSSRGIPPSVMDRIREMRGAPGNRPRPFWRGRTRGMDPPPDRGPTAAPPPEDGRPLDRPRFDGEGRRLRDGPMRFQAGPFPKFIMRTSGPKTYWVGVRLPGLAWNGNGPQGPMTLLMSSSSLSMGGLLMDPTPWIIVLASVVVGSALFWFPLVHGITRSIKRMTEATQRIAAGRLDARISERRSDELGRLGQSIDSMAAQLERFVSGQKRFLGDTAHELCSPIARMQMALGILEQRADDAQRGYVEDVKEEVQHMSALIHELLAFSKASLRPTGVTLEPVALLPLVQSILKREVRDAADVRLSIAEDLQVNAEPELLGRSLSNLLRNALRYAGKDGPIDVAAQLHGDRVDLTIADQGPGIPVESLHRIFDPFYRPQAARERETGGIGLGLAIVKTCVEACGGQVSARNRQPSGLEVVVSLPSV